MERKSVMFLGISIFASLSCVCSLPTHQTVENYTKRSVFVDRCPFITSRQDCTTQGGSTAETCFESGCIWCPLNEDQPFCIYDPDQGQQGCLDIPDSSKQDCMPDSSTVLDAAGEGLCYFRDCFWCVSETPDIPWCSYNSTAWLTTPAVLGSQNYRVDCTPEDGSTENECLARGCIYSSSDTQGVPWCYLPVNYGYQMLSTISTIRGYTVTLKRNPHPSLYGNESETIYLEVEFQTESRLRLKFYDDSDRYEVPVNITSPEEAPTSTLYNVTFSNEPVFSIQVVRKDTGTIIFDTSLGGLTFSDQYLQLATLLPSTTVYGFGEDEQYTFKHSFNWQTWAFWARDQGPSGSNNLYGVHPHYTVVENDGNTHGVLILNSNAQEVVFTPAPGLVYRTIGGILDLYLFLGPTPENTVEQYTEAIGRLPIPPYWSLGFQLSRWGYNNLTNMEIVVNRTAASGIPQDVQYGDIDIMNQKLDFTYDPINFAGLPQYMKELKANGIRFIPIVDPGIAIIPVEYKPYVLGQEMDVWVKRQNGTSVVGQVWPTPLVHYPDFTKSNTSDWWVQNIVTFKELLDWEGIWIDMNEPSNFVAGDYIQGCEDNTINYPPYIPHITDSSLFVKTICADSVQVGGLHYNIHSLYGMDESKATQRGVRAATGKRSFVLSRSTFVSSGKYTNHWLGDNTSDWPDMKYSIIGILQFNHFGIPMVGADICGFNGNSNLELCQRWMEVGAFSPFCRNHNTEGAIDQDPAVWGPAVANSSRNALLIRYTILPYIYTLFYQHYTQGGTVARALWHEFPTDSNTYSVDEQFLLGPAFMISPVLTEGATSVEAYFPNARWFDYYDGSEVSEVGMNHTLNAPSEHIPLHVRGGYILPTQFPAANTDLSRQQPMGLLVALDENYEAAGSLFYDDGDSIDTVENGEYFYATFTVYNGELHYNIKNNGYSGMSNISIGDARVLGMANATSHIFINGKQHEQFYFNSETKELIITAMDISANSQFILSWK